MRRAIAIIALGIVLLGFGAFPALAGGPNNVVVSDSTVDATTGQPSTVVNSRVLVGSTGTDEVTSTNLASARSHDCTGCVATAVAFQAVVMTGNPDTASPRNVAAAVNESCTSCVTFAFAYQYAVTSSDSLSLSPAGAERLAAFRRQVDDLANDPTLDPFTRGSRLHALEPDFRAIIDDELARAGSGSEHRDDDEKVDAPPATAPAA